MDKAIVITSINPPKKEIRSFSKINGWKLVCVGDKKTPTDWISPNVEYVSPQLQNSLFPNFSKVFPWNLYARKNFGYLFAIKNGAKIIYESDDDMYPYKNFPPELSLNRKAKILSGDKFINVHKFFLKNKSTPLWARGFPLSYIKSTNKIKVKVGNVKTPIINCVQEKDGDFDTIFRFIFKEWVDFKKGISYTTEKGSYAPTNTQSTFHYSEAFSLLYVPGTVTSRSEDIYRGYIAQRILWESGQKVLFTSPVASSQNRNKHNKWKDFELEISLFLDIPKLIEILDTLSLYKDPIKSLIKVYNELAKRNLVDKREINMVNAWAMEIEKLM